jgi:predicted Zn-dependent protease
MKESRPGILAATLAGFCLLALAQYSCAVNPVTGRSELQIVTFSEEEEVALGGKAYVPAVQQQGGFYRDPELSEYVQGVGMRLARVSHRPNLNYRYRVLNSSVPNAFALPGGYIVINRGSWRG